MRFGIATTDPTLFPVMERCGYTLIECDYQAIRAMTKEERTAFCREAADHGLAVEGFNCFATCDMAILRWSEAEADAYFENVVTCGLPMGVRYLVIGSGKARSIPEGMDRAAALKRWNAMLHRFGDIARRYGVEIFLEPLSHNETNLLNTVADAAACCREVAHPQVNTMADFYHLGENNEPFSRVSDAGVYLKHIHVALSPGRRTPLVSDEPLVREMARAIQAAGYDGRAVLEGNLQQPDVATAVGEFSRLFSLFERD